MPKEILRCAPPSSQECDFLIIICFSSLSINAKKKFWGVPHLPCIYVILSSSGLLLFLPLILILQLLSLSLILTHFQKKIELVLLGQSKLGESFPTASGSSYCELSVSFLAVKHLSIKENQILVCAWSMSLKMLSFVQIILTFVQVQSRA